MKRNSRFLWILIAAMVAGCAGRMPETGKTTKIIHKHFKKYGKKYPTSPFGGKKVTQVEILNVEEIHKHLVAATAFVTIEGPEVFKVRMTIEKGPFGWRYLSWENVGGQN